MLGSCHYSRDLHVTWRLSQLAKHQSLGRYVCFVISHISVFLLSILSLYSSFGEDLVRLLYLFTVPVLSALALLVTELTLQILDLCGLRGSLFVIIILSTSVPRNIVGLYSSSDAHLWT